MSNSPIPPNIQNGAWHPKCRTWWTGARAAHCPACCLTFSSTTAFDQHQRATEPGRLCRDPKLAGLVPIDKPYGILWSSPPSDSDWTRSALPDADTKADIR